MSGILCRARAVALPIIMILCLVVATAAASAQSTGSLKCQPLNPGPKGLVTLTYTTVQFRCTTPVKTTLTVATGTDQKNLVPTPDARSSRTSHVVTVAGLQPNTTYYAQVTATPKTGKPLKQSLKFATPAPGTVTSPVTTVSQRGNQLLLNGSPSFVIAMDAVTCPDDQNQLVAHAVSVGADVIKYGAGACPSPSMTTAQQAQALHTVLNSQAWWWDTRVSDNQALTGLLPELLSGLSTALDEWRQSVVENICDTTTKLSAAISRASKTQPVIYSISLATSPHRIGENWCLTGKSLAMAFWSCVAAGCNGISYSTADAGNASFFDVKPELISQAARQQSQIATFGTVALTGKPVQIKTDGQLSIVSGWKYGGELYIVAVNGDKPTKTTFSVPGTTAKVMWENRSMKIVGGKLADNFAPQAVHRYQIPLTTK